MTRDEFIKEARSIHGNDFEYDKVPYTEIYTTNHIDVYCNKCKEYYRVKVWHHIRAKQKHFKCFTRPHALNTELFITKSKKVHGDKFGYDKVNYVDSVKTVTILCKACGEYYEQRPTFHMAGKGHGMCKFNQRGYDNEYFISKAKEIHGDKYDYSKTDYVHSLKPVTVTCKKHGDFSIIAGEHIRERGAGCSVCISSTGERSIAKILKRNNVKFVEQFRFEGTRYRYDFYLPELNVLVEYDGQLHYIAVDYFGGVKTLERIQYNDNIKNALASSYNIPLVRIGYMNFNMLENTLTNKIRRYIKYCRDGKYFKSFLEYSQYFKLPGYAKPNEHTMYLFKLK